MKKLLLNTTAQACVVVVCAMIGLLDLLYVMPHFVPAYEPPPQRSLAERQDVSTPEQQAWQAQLRAFDVSTIAPNN